MDQVFETLSLSPDSQGFVGHIDQQESVKQNKTLLIACGALAREILAFMRLNKLEAFELTCLPAIWHNHPEKIVPGLIKKIEEHQAHYRDIVVIYGDCGTGGELDVALRSRGVKRIPGPHCYSFFAGEQQFNALMEEELGSLFLTDFLVKHFDRLILEGLGLIKHPELRDMIFGSYKRLVYLAQMPTQDLQDKAKQAAKTLGLAYEFRDCGFGELGQFLAIQAIQAAQSAQSASNNP